VTEVAGNFTGPLRPFPYTFRGLRDVPDHIKKPDYATTGAPNQHFQTLANKSAPIYTDEEDIVKLRKVCLIAR